MEFGLPTTSQSVYQPYTISNYKKTQTSTVQTINTGNVLTTTADYPATSYAKPAAQSYTTTIESTPVVSSQEYATTNYETTDYPVTQYTTTTPVATEEYTTTNYETVETTPTVDYTAYETVTPAVQEVAAPATTSTVQYQQRVVTKYVPKLVTKMVQQPYITMMPLEKAKALGLPIVQNQTPMPVPTTSLIQTPQPAVQQLPAVPQPVQSVIAPQPVQSVITPQPVQTSQMVPQKYEDHFVRNYNIYDPPRSLIQTTPMTTTSSVFNPNSMAVNDFRVRTSLPQTLNPTLTQSTYLPNVNTGLTGLSTSLPNVNANLPTLNTSLPNVNGNLPSLNANLPSLNANLPNVNTGLSQIGNNLTNAGNNLTSGINNIGSNKIGRAHV